MKLELGTWKEKLKGKDRYETAENYSIVFMTIGVVILSIGFLLSIFNPQGISVILIMLGELLSFISTIAIVFVWLIKELLG